MAEEHYTNKYHMVFEPGSNPTVNNDMVVHGSAYFGGTNQVQSQHFPMCREDRYLKQLYQFLIAQNWIAGSTHPDNFVYLMGGMERSPRIQPVVWQNKPQLLREMLEMVFSPVIDRGVVKKADLERIVPICFSKDGKPLMLPNTKHEASMDYDKLMNFLATIG